jgi:hypothetical protein
MTTQEILNKVASGEIQATEAATLIAAMNASGKSATELTYKPGLFTTRIEKERTIA